MSMEEYSKLSRTGVSLPDAVQCHAQGILFILWGRSYLFCRGYSQHILSLTNSSAMAKVYVRKKNKIYRMRDSEEWNISYFLIFRVFVLLSLSSLLYSPNVLASVSFGLLQVFHVKFRSPRRTLNQTLYLVQGVDCSHFVNHDQVQVISYSKYSTLYSSSWDWTCSL